VLDAIHERIKVLAGYTPKTNQSLEEMPSRAKAG